MTSRLVPAGLIGAASGLRSQLGIGAAIATTPAHALPGPMQNPVSKPLAVLLALGEVVADKHPSVPPRTALPGLVPRLGLGAGSAVLLAKRTGEPVAVPAAVGLAAAAAVALVGLRVRAVVDSRLSPISSAILEDLSSAAFAAAAVLLAPTAPASPPAGAPSASPDV